MESLSRTSLVVHDEFIVKCDENVAEETRKQVDEIMLTVAKKFNPDMKAMAVESTVTDKWKK